MPYKSEKIKLQGLQDRRRKLTEEQKSEIVTLYSTGLHSYNSLAKEFGVSKSLICIIINPERAKKVREYVKDNWKKYSDRKKLTEAVRNLRRYKQRLYLEGKLENKTDDLTDKNTDSRELDTHKAT